jgi:hypothetical protein
MKFDWPRLNPEYANQFGLEAAGWPPKNQRTWQLNILLRVIQALFVAHTVIGTVSKLSNSEQVIPALREIPHLLGGYSQCRRTSEALADLRPDACGFRAADEARSRTEGRCDVDAGMPGLRS